VRERFLAAAADVAMEAGRIQRSRYGDKIAIEHKGVIDLVTEVDHACEAAIVTRLRGWFPDHDIVTEETHLGLRGSRFVWFTDPLDGTTNYAHGYPVFCASVALVEDGQVVVGAVYDPMREELFTAERAQGARVNGQPLRVSQSADLLSSLLITGFPYDLRDDLAGKLRLFNRIMGEARAVRRDGSAALNLAYVAAGRLDGFWEERLQPWDMLAGILMVEEAGGRATRFDGSALRPQADEIVATNGKLHPAMLEIFRRDREERASV
jgi:myo-inositol-1(or 4)-monophosphatase